MTKLSLNLRKCLDRLRLRAHTNFMTNPLPAQIARVGAFICSTLVLIHVIKYGGF